MNYPQFDKAIQLCLKAGVACKLSKSDMRAAFRNLCVKLAQWRLLVMKCESPIDGKVYFFVDKCLPFGAAISCALFQRFSDAIAHIVRCKMKRDLLNYLDDFLFIALLTSWCNEQVSTFLEVCRVINFPVSMEKTQWATTKLEFLGLLIDSIKQVVSVPIQKIEKGLLMIQQTMNKKKLTLKQLQKICGFLNFLGRSVVPGRAFTRRLYMYTKGKEVALKPHHHIQVNAEIKKDLTMWEEFLNHPMAYCRPFLDFESVLKVDEVAMTSDAAKSDKLGFAAVCQDSWTYGSWDGFVKKFDPSIEYLELYGVLVGVLNWLHRFRNRRIILFCDNQAVVAMINKNTSSCKNCLTLIRMLVLHSMKLNVRVFAKYITSRDNLNSDLLSRQKVMKFKQLNLNADSQMTPLPAELHPIDKLWAQ